MKYFIDNGFLVYERKGHGVPLLFIHGFPLSRKIWYPQQEALTDIADVISVDLRGHGESYPFDGPYPMELLADDCKRILESENISERLIVCGLSMGGYVALALYRKYPQIFKALILTSTRAGADSDQGRANRDKTIKQVIAYKDVGNIVDNMIPRLLSGSSLSNNPKLVHALRQIMLETSPNGVIGASLGMRDRPDSTPLLPQIHFPVLIIHGEDDQLIPLQEAEKMNSQIIKSDLEIVPSAGHLPNMEQPDRYNQIVRKFIGMLP
jgi:3-oxoadipate enol-lactonase